jgi:hypothetical protein
MARSLGTIRPEGTHKERSQKRIALALEVCTTAVTETLSAPPMIGMRARGLLVLDLKAAGALPSSAMAEATFLGSHTIMLTLSCMHHALSESRSQTVQRRQFDRHEPFDHARRIAARRCSTSASMCFSRAAQREQRSGAREGRECSSLRTRRGAPAALWAL